MLAAAIDSPWTTGLAVTIVVICAVIFLVAAAIGARYIPHDRVGIVEKLWSSGGSVPEGGIIALNKEAGYQSELLRGGLHFGYWRWQYRIHRAPLVTIPQGKIGYVYARDGEPLVASQTLGRVVDCNNFQDARKFLSATPSRQGHLSDPVSSQARGQRGRQRAILREGVYAINLAMFVVISEDRVFCLNADTRIELEKVIGWQKQLKEVDGFNPVVIGEQMTAIDPLNPEHSIIVDSIGIVTVHDGPSLNPGEIIAPAVGNDSSDANYHNNYQDTEAFLAAGGRRGRQYVPLTDGTYFLNRWFASVEITPKTVVPIGYVGVVVSYYGPIGKDLSGDSFRHGERVNRGERGVWERPFGPGKYPFNTYAGQIILVPTTNFVLHWITGKQEAHRYDDTLKSIDLVTKDAYEPMLPLSVVVHIDYMKAPSVIQRFGDVKKLITQTLDPMLSAFFRDVAHKKTMLELLQHRDDIQLEARGELQRRFLAFDIECVDVLIGKPDTAEAGGKIETLLEQLRQRQLSKEQVETYEHQRLAADEQRKLNEAQARAAKQKEVTDSLLQVQIAQNAGDADLARARKQAEQTIVVAEAEYEKSKRAAQQTIVTAEADSRQRELAGRGESVRQMQIGLSEATVLMKKISSFGDPRLYALSLVTENLSKSTQPLVPERVFTTGGAPGGTGENGLVSQLLSLLVAEKSGFALSDVQDTNGLKEFSDRMTKEAMASMEQAVTAAPTRN
ncbi:MAG: hypothetical protein H7Z14_01480 [Anaerolineae bacterium]|nr:hypothetical protein [Phycisphaerae bacterium]